MVNEGEDSDLTDPFNDLLEVGLRYISLVAKEAHSHSQHATYKFWRALLNKAYELLDKVRNLSHPPLLIIVQNRYWLLIHTRIMSTLLK